MRRLLTAAIYALSALVGVAAFTYPFFLPQLAGQQADIEAASTTAHLSGAPLLTMVLLTLCLAVLLLEIQGQVVSVKVVAALGVLVAITAILRFVETAIPGPGGFSPIFAPIILAGYVFGARFGFLMGALTIVVSALITAGVGPWLPYQMFTAGWVGLTAGWLPHLQRPRLELALLAAFGFGWGLLYGAITNLSFWPFVAGSGAMTWSPGLSWQTGVARYAAFYLSTSLIWDLVSGVGNVILILALGLPAVRALARFRHRFQFTVQTG
jgi:energy-coupling factor transport system substrate-specific component